LQAIRNPDNLLGRYVRLRQLGAGGMGVVWLAWDRQLRRLVALKLLSGPGGAPADSHDTSGDEIKRFYREAQTAAKLRHPNIVPIFDVGREKDAAGRTLYYIAMEYIDGPTLDRAGLPVRRVLEVMRDIARAVHYAHQQGIVHRDLKPLNIMLDAGGRPTVMDFGLAKQSNVASSLSATGSVVGTPAFMPPEQARGVSSDVNARSDVYALGATLYALVTGRPPYSGGGAMEILEALVARDPPRPRSLNPKLHVDIETIVLRAMERDPMRRYLSAEDFALDLHRYLEGEPILARPAGIITRAAKKLKRHRARAAGSAAIAALLAAVALLAFGLRTRPLDSGEPWVTVLEDGFDRAELGPRWVPMRGQTQIHDGELCSRNGILIFALPMAGDLEFEFDGRVMPDSPDCKEISVFLHGSREMGLSEGYALEFGIGENTYNCVQRLRVVAKEARSGVIEKGRRYRMLARRVADTVAYQADGGELVSYRDPAPLPAAGHFGFASQCQHLHFDNLVLRQPLTAAAKSADRAFEAKEYAVAEKAYAAYLQRRSGAYEAVARRAMCLFHLGRAEEAEAQARAPLTEPGHPEAAAAQGASTLAQIYLAQRRFAEAEEVLGAAHGRLLSAEARQQVETAWRQATTRIGQELQGDELLEFWADRARRWRNAWDLGHRYATNVLLTLHSQRNDPESYLRLVREAAAAGSPGDESAPGHRYVLALLRWRRGEVEEARRTLREQFERAEMPGAPNWAQHRTQALSYLVLLEASEGRPTVDLRRSLEEMLKDPSFIDEFVLWIRERLLLADLLEGDAAGAARRLEGIVDHCRRGIDLQPQNRHVSEFYLGRISPEDYQKAKLLFDFRPEHLLRIALALLARGDRERGREFLGRYAAQTFAGQAQPAAVRLLERLR
jgi:hypothetical protein